MLSRLTQHPHPSDKLEWGHLKVPHVICQLPDVLPILVGVVNVLGDPPKVSQPAQTKIATYKI